MTMAMAAEAQQAEDFISRVEKQNQPDMMERCKVSSAMSRPSSRQASGYTSHLRKIQDNISIFDSQG